MVCPIEEAVKSGTKPPTWVIQIQPLAGGPVSEPDITQVNPRRLYPESDAECQDSKIEVEGVPEVAGLSRQDARQDETFDGIAVEQLGKAAHSEQRTLEHDQYTTLYASSERSSL